MTSRALSSAEVLPHEDGPTRPKPSRAGIKILYIINDLSVGGAEMMLYRLLSKLNRERFHPTVVSLMDRGSLRGRVEELGVPVHRLGMRQIGPTPASLWRLARVVRRVDPDLINGWLYHGSLAGQMASALAPRGGVPVLWNIYSSNHRLSLEKKLTAAVIKVCAYSSRRPAGILFDSYTAQANNRAVGFCVENSRVIPNGIDTEQFVPSEMARLSVRAELGVPKNTFLVGTIGRSHPMKDHANFLRAAALVSKQRPDVRFLMAGQNVSRGNRELARLIRRTGLRGRVHALGERPDVPWLAAALDVFSLPSAYGESCPNVIGEAMACGVPCAATDVGDTARLIGDTGRVVPPRDAAALAGAWEQLIELAPEDRRALGKAARERIVNHFSLEAVTAQHEDLYESLSANKSLQDWVVAPPRESVGDLL